MPKVKISEYSATANSNTDVASINIDEGCAPSGINNAIRAIMGHLKDFQSGTSNDPFTVGSSGSLTLSYGTANGVAYLNGSKVLTTGSALVFDGSNLGLGVTPSAWDSGWSAIQVSTQGASFVGRTGGNEAISLSNAYRNSASWKYITSTSASMYQCGNGIHTWFIAPSGTAGNAISFTQAMTLNASGNLGIGTTSPVTRLEIKDTTNNTALTVTSSYEASLQLVNGGGSEVSVINAGGSNILSLRTANTEGARIDSSGNLGIGTTSPSFRLHAVSSAAVVSRIGSSGGSGAFINFIDSGASPSVAPSVGAIGNSLVFMGDGSSSERARIDSSGNLIQTAPTTAPTLSTNGTMVFNLTSNTNLRVSVRGSDGVTRTANLTLA